MTLQDELDRLRDERDTLFDSLARSNESLQTAHAVIAEFRAKVNDLAVKLTAAEREAERIRSWTLAERAAIDAENTRLKNDVAAYASFYARSEAARVAAVDAARGTDA